MSIPKVRAMDKYLDEHGFGFFIEWEVEPHWADFKVFEIVATDVDGSNPSFEARLLDGQQDSLTLNTEHAEPYLKGYIKWDGCCEFGAHTHYCGSDCLKKHAALVQFLYKRAPELMGRGWDNLDMTWDHGGSSLSLRK